MEPLEIEIYRHYLQQIPSFSPQKDKITKTTSLRELLREYEVFFFDAWGTLYVQEEPFPGAIDALQFLRSAGATVRLITNNASVSQKELLDSLHALGFDFSSQEVISSGGMLGAEAEKLDISEAFHLGRDHSVETLRSAGVRASDSPTRPVVILSSHPLPDQEEERVDQALFQLRRPDSLLLVLNPDAMAPQVGAPRMEVAGSLGFKLARESGCRTLYIGKPFPEIFQKALASLPAGHGRVVMAGDTIGTDIAGAQQCGISSLLLLEGNCTPQGWKEDARKLGVTPDYVAEKISN